MNAEKYDFMFGRLGSFRSLKGVGSNNRDGVGVDPGELIPLSHHHFDPPILADLQDSELIFAAEDDIIRLPDWEKWGRVRGRDAGDGEVNKYPHCHYDSNWKQDGFHDWGERCPPLDSQDKEGA